MAASIFNFTASMLSNATNNNSSSSSPWNQTTNQDNNSNISYYDDDDFDITMIMNISNYTRTPMSPPPLIYNPQKGHTTSVGVLILAILLVVLSVLLTILVLHILRYRLMRRLLALRRQEQLQHAASNRRQLSAEQKDERYSIIEEWLISKRVLQHDEACARLLDALSTEGPTDEASVKDNYDASSLAASEWDYSVSVPETFSAAASRDLASTETNNDDIGCPICMSPFEAGEIVSCSADEQCSHIYHHECIKEWLLNHTECPFCRNIFLDVDKPDHNILKSPQQLTKRAQLSYCCLVHGLVELSPQLCLRANLVDAIESKVRGELTLIQRGDLMAKRGARQAFHEDKELTVDEASMACLASRAGDDSPSIKERSAEEEEEPDLEASVQQGTSTPTDETGERTDQYLI